MYHYLYMDNDLWYIFQMMLRLNTHYHIIINLLIHIEYQNIIKTKLNQIQYQNLLKT